MYFGLVLVYPALRFINDISLMNFSALTSRRPFICCNVTFSFTRSSCSWFCLEFHRFNRVIRFPASAVQRFPFLLGLQR